MGKKLQGNILLLITALIWGSAFVAQSAGMNYIGPFTYNMVRNFVAFIVLIPVVFIFRKLNYRNKPLSKEESRKLNKKSIIGGIFCGIALGAAGNLQQLGVSMTTAGKAGFITAIYIIMVPILGIFVKRKAEKKIWLCAFVALIGFYLLCIKDGFSISTGDLLCLVCALGYSVHIIVIDHYSAQNTDGVMMSCVQLLVAGIISAILTALFETPTLDGIWAAKITILYTAVLSSGVAYTLQIIAQGMTDPTVSTLLMSLESVFSALFGWLILHEALSPKELLGCALVFVAVIFAQIPLNVFSKKRAYKTD